MKFKLNWGNSILIFFIGFLSLAFFFIAFSLRHHNDLVVDNYYEQGANYTQQMNVDARSILFQDSVSVFKSDESISFTLAPSVLEKVSEVKIFCYRAMDKRDDVIKVFKASESLSFSKASFKSGRYDVTVSWEIDEEVFEVKKRISVKL